jgi:hypothetical protein
MTTTLGTIAAVVLIVWLVYIFVAVVLSAGR